MPITNTFIHLIGFPGTGKLTIAQQLQTLVPAILVDNHLINNVVFTLVDPDGKTKLPSSVWDNVRKVRSVVIDTIRDCAKPERNFIFTNALRQGFNDDQVAFDQVAELARQRSAQHFVARLLISRDELCRRIVSPDRKAKFKAISAEEARDLSDNHEVLHVAGSFDLDVTDFSAEEAAKAL